MIQARLTELNMQEVLMYMGFRGQEYSEDLNDQMTICRDRIIKAAEPRVVWKRVPYKDGFAGDIELPGKDIAAMLEESTEVILMAATIGPQIEKLMMRYEVSDMADAVIMDSFASVAIENVCNNFESDMRSLLEKETKYLTSRFSPGYGDLPIEIQKDLCGYLDTHRRIGLTVSDNYLMVPRKSVTAVMGISDKPQKLRSDGCASCNMFRECSYRKEGRVCNA